MLVTRGVYAFVRHPGYLGWLLWSVGTQVLLQNPLSAPMFAYVVRRWLVHARARRALTPGRCLCAWTQSWRFFARRIPFEEARLREFFGRWYDDYAARTPTYIPFIR